jgi:hypothetical protein
MHQFGLAAFLAIVLLTQLGPVNIQNASAASPNLCHFGIAAPYGVSDYDLSTLGVGSYLDWSASRTSSVPANITYFHVLKVGDDVYATVSQNLDKLLTKYKGEIWIIGNEPDSEVRYQDHISAETYAERYFALATTIRNNDPAARIAFGTIIQPTKIRMAYIQKALDRLVQLNNGDKAKALGMIDIYSIHAFILNEAQMYEYDAQGNIIKNLTWGAGLPIGYQASWGQPEVIRIDGEVNETWKTYSFDLYKERIVRFRQWMKDNGEQNKELWVTEYGSLFPNWLNVSDQTTATFMEQTFDYTLGHQDANLGYAGDHNRLVQQLVWYSLNEQRDLYGGSLYDPQTKQRTLVGDRFIGYNPSTAIEPLGDVDVAMVAKAPVVLPGGRGTQPDMNGYRILVRATNLISSDRRVEVQVDLYDEARFVGSSRGFLPRCGGEGEFMFTETDLAPGTDHNYRAVVSLIAGNGTEINPANQDVILPTTTMPDIQFLFLANIQK